jgi:hypothetical protein
MVTAVTQYLAWYRSSGGIKISQMNKAIMSSIFFLGYSHLDIVNLFSPNVNERLENIKNLAQDLIDHNLIKLRPIEICEDLDYAFKRELEWVDSVGVSNLLNSRRPTGNPPTAEKQLPYSDIAFLIAIGFEYDKIIKILNENGIPTSRTTFVNKIRRVFGEKEVAQINLLKQTIENYVDSIPFNRRKTFSFPNIKNLADIITEIAGGPNSIESQSWFLKWRAGDVILSADLKNVKELMRFRISEQSMDIIQSLFSRVFGYTFKDILKLLIKNPGTKVAELLNIPFDHFDTIMRKKGGFSQLQDDIRRKIAIELLSLGLSPERICQKTFGYKSTDKRAIERIFQRIFGGMTLDEIMNTNWVRYVKDNKNYYIDFFGLVKGIDY